MSQDVRVQNRQVEEESLLSRTLDRLQGLIVVVNAERRVVYANQAFLDYFDRDEVDKACGFRLGEIFHCVHAEEAREGCGGSESCRFCGAILAILETQTSGMPATKECRIASSNDGKLSNNEFLVRTFPFEIGGTSFIMVSFRDISEQKRRIALERVFFHDILNTVSSIKVYLDLLKMGVSEDSNRKLLYRLEAISDTLMEEIQSQKILVSAENKTLKVQRHLIESMSLLRQIIQQIEDQEICRGKKIAVAPFSETAAFTSDDSLLKRVLANMAKNAVEASPDGSTVTVGFHVLDASRVQFWVHNPTHIPEEIQRQIFHRYFSTKGGDRGLGTYSMKLLTEEYLGGKVAFESSPEKGTTFTVTLPLRS
jgi:signal transduction histidine kinase